MKNTLNSWGAIYIYSPSKNRQQLTRELVIKAFKEEKWGSDEVLILQERNADWVSVLSRQWEFSKIGNHPLAKSLSRSYPVLSVTCVEGKYSEFSIYQNGKVQQLSIFGKNIPTNNTHNIVAFDPLWLRGKEAADLTWHKNKDEKAYCECLEKCFTDPEQFIARIGLTSRGFRRALEEAPLSEYSPNQYLIFQGIQT